MKFDGLDSIKDPVLRNILRQIQNRFTNLEDDFGLVPVSQQDRLSRIAPPPLASFASVEGRDGRFVIQLNEADIGSSVNGPVLYELMTSSTIPFSTSRDVVRYGPDARHSWELLDPGSLKFIQARSRFINSKFNKPVPWPGGQVDAGLIGASSLDPSVLPPTSTSAGDVGLVAGMRVILASGIYSAIESLHAGDVLRGVDGDVVLTKDAEAVTPSIDLINLSTAEGNGIVAGQNTQYAMGDGGLTTMASAIVAGSIYELDGAGNPVSSTIATTATEAPRTLYRLHLDSRGFCFIENVLFYFGVD